MKVRNMHRWWTNILWWVKHRTTNRYHIVAPKTLEPAWHDFDYKLLHVMMQMLVDFVEGEMGGPEELQEDIDWRISNCIWEDTGENYEQGRIDALTEVLEIYKWWKTEPEIDLFEEGPLRCERYMIRLVELRGYLWT